MAPRKPKESLLELCNRATVLGNSVSVRMLEYLSSTKNYPSGFRELATEFLDICRILWSIDAGLTEASRKQNKFPVEMVSELDTKFRQTNDDFVCLNQMLLKFLEYESKGTFGSLRKGWRMMFAGNDIDKMRASLCRNRDALRMSALVFRWSIGDEKADAAAGMGYTGLVAAVERMNKNKQTTLPPLNTLDTFPLEEPPQLPAIATLDRASKSLPSIRDAAEVKHSLSIADRSLVYRSPSIRSGQMSPHSVTMNGISRHNALSPTDSGFGEGSFSDAKRSNRSSNDQDVTLYDNETTKYPVVRNQADPSSVPRWTPRGITGVSSPNSKTSLTNAIKTKNHKLLEQLLDSGIGRDGGLEDFLATALLDKDIESVRLLLLFGADPNAPLRDQTTALFAAISSRFLEGVKLLMKYGADPNLCAGSEEETPLAFAVGENAVDLVYVCLSYGGDAASVMANGSTALIKSITKSAPARLVELLLEYGTNPNSKDSEGKTALFEAIQVKRIDLLTLLLDHGGNPNLPGPKHLLWPSTYQPKILKLLLTRGADPSKAPGIMELASSIKNLDSITILLENGVSPNLRKDGIYTPLCSAIRDDSVDIVTLLLATGADPNFPASEYPAFKCVTHDRMHILPQLVEAGADLNTPKGIIETAVQHNHVEAIKYLLDQGVSPNDRNPKGNTALTTAIRDNRPELVDLLLQNGADPGIRGEDWPICMAVKQPAILKKLLPHLANPRAVRGVMEMAVVANQLDSIKLLLKAGISVEDKNGGVFSPLTTAIREDRKELVRFLLDEAGADPNAPGEHLPIIKALRRYRNNDSEIIEMLLARRANINKMYRGWNAILQAVENGDSKILELLVEKGGGVDLSVTDDAGRPIIDIIAERGWEEALTILLNSENVRR